jgi:hypothetical protein
MPPASQRNIKTVLILSAALLTPCLGGPHHAVRLVAGQGLAVSPDNLGAGVDATANEFEQFESALELATTGGRGRYVAWCEGCLLKRQALTAASSHCWQQCCCNSGFCRVKTPLMPPHKSGGHRDVHTQQGELQLCTDQQLRDPCMGVCQGQGWNISSPLN